MVVAIAAPVVAQAVGSVAAVGAAGRRLTQSVVVVGPAAVSVAPRLAPMVVTAAAPGPPAAEPLAPSLMIESMIESMHLSAVASALDAQKEELAVPALATAAMDLVSARVLSAFGRPSITSKL